MLKLFQHPLRNTTLALSMAVTLLPVSGCFSRHIQKESHVKVNAPVKTANLDQLVLQVNEDAARIQTLNATVAIASDFENAKQESSITQYTEIRGYVLIRKPGMIRMFGLAPIVRTRIFDMASQGGSFNLSTPPYNKFFIGSNEVKFPSKNSIENMRPQHILDAVLVNGVNTRDDIPTLEVGVDQFTDPVTKQLVYEQDYILDVIHRDLDGVWAIQRKIYFSRTDLRVHKQVIFNKDGSIATSATYEDFKDFDGVQFPSIIRIQRPQEGYTIQLAAVTLKINTELSDDKFEITQPPGSQLINMDEPQPEEPKTDVKPEVKPPLKKKK